MLAGSEAGAYNSLGYLTIRIDWVLYLGHRLAWFLVTGEPPLFEIDHENGDPSDNRIWNLRPATHSQNQANQKIDKTNTSGRKGVSWNREKAKWEARIQINGKSKFLGYHVDKEIAAESYALAAEKYFGSFSRLQ